MSNTVGTNRTAAAPQVRDLPDGALGGRARDAVAVLRAQDAGGASVPVLTGDALAA